MFQALGNRVAETQNETNLIFVERAFVGKITFAAEYVETGGNFAATRNGRGLNRGAELESGYIVAEEGLRNPEPLLSLGRSRSSVY